MRSSREQPGLLARLACRRWPKDEAGFDARAVTPRLCGNQEFAT